jgi:hypothetical protein
VGNPSPVPAVRVRPLGPAPGGGVPGVREGRMTPAPHQPRRLLRMAVWPGVLLCWVVILRFAHELGGTTGMMAERIVGAAWTLGGIALMVILAGQWAQHLALSATLACPRCRYSMTGLHVAHCPECGSMLSAARSIETATMRARAQAVVILCFVVGVIGFTGILAARELLQVNRLVKIGRFAFLPDYSLLDSTTNLADLAILAGTAALVVSAAAKVIRQCRRGLRDYQEGVRRIACEYERGLVSMAESGGCVGCGYNFSDLPPGAACPECGRTASRHDTTLDRAKTDSY